ncbi:hypothetical protein DHD80_12735 [Gramella sp. AN32]|nr:hypothetical protein [Gramella sp. AN32]
MFIGLLWKGFGKGVKNFQKTFGLDRKVVVYLHPHLLRGMPAYHERPAGFARKRDVPNKRLR